MLHLGVDSLAGDALHFVALRQTLQPCYYSPCRFEGRRTLSFQCEARFIFCPHKETHLHRPVSVGDDQKYIVFVRNLCVCVLRMELLRYFFLEWKSN